MGKNVNFVSHKKSKLTVDGKPKLPSAESLVEGELAINFAENVETISLKNESGTVVTFSSDNYYTELKLGSGFTGANSAVTVTDVIKENEEIISTALNDLNERKLDASAYTPSVELWEAGSGNNAAVLKNSSGTASGDFSVAEGSETLASGSYGSHAEGQRTSATSDSSHAEGGSTLASGYYSHAEGNGTVASGSYGSHAEGVGTKAYGESSHAEGNNTIANNYDAHAEGSFTVASGSRSHAEGERTSANTYASHTEGYYTVANNWAEHASGQYNVSNSASTAFGNSGNTLFSVGNGTADNARHNAFEIRQNGDIYIVSGGTNIKLQDNIGGGGGSITVDQVIDSGTSASTNAVATHAVYDAITDNELVWTNAYVTLSGTVSAHTADTTIHVTAVDKEKLHTHSNKSALDAITGNVGTMAYENKTSYSSATDVSNALSAKVNSATYTGHTADTTIHSISVVSAVTVSADLTNVTCPTSITGSSKSGAQAVVIYENSGSTADYTISVSTTYKTPDGNQIQMTCPKNGYCEVNYLNINGIIYARGI